MTSVRLEPFGAEHLADVRAMFADPESIRFTRISENAPEGFFEQWQARYEEGRADGTREAFVVVDEADAVVGIVMAPRIDPRHGEAELGYLVAPAARGRGLATEALRRMTDWALGERKLHRLELQIGIDNVASQKVAERCGYVFEGIKRQAYVKDGVRMDTQIWSRLASD